jgi:hypothetical protein
MSIIKSKEDKGVSGMFPEFFSTDFLNDDKVVTSIEYQ